MTAKSDFLPNLAKTSVAFPENYKTTFRKYTAINFPATKQVRYYYANDVALQAAAVLTGSLAPAYLYRALRQSSSVRSHWVTLAVLAGVGLAGLLGAVLLGPVLLSVVFGAAFTSSQPYLVAGFAAAVLFFVDQFVQIAITANNRPWLLALKWGTASVVALATLVWATPHIGAYSGPAGLALGLVASWIAVAVGARWAGASETQAAMFSD